MLNPNATTEAINWVIRLRDPATADWDELIYWLEVSPDNAAAYNAATLADADIAEALVSTAPPVTLYAANDNFWRPWRYAGIAAALLIAVAAYPLYNFLTPAYAIETGLGQPREIALDDGSVIALNGGTRITLDKRNPRIATLDYGEAQFTVKHNAAKPFVVKAGGSVFQDVGTVFNVRRDNRDTELAVSEGSVLFNPSMQAVLLKTGHRLTAKDGDAKPALSIVDPAIIGGWRSGRLSYDAAPLSRVASDLSRFIGTQISVAPNIANRRFTGSIAVGKKDADRDALNRVSVLMGVRVAPTAGGWQLTAL